MIVCNVIDIPNAEGLANAFYASLTKWGSLGTGNGQFKIPLDVAVNSSIHNLYVADSGNNRIQKFLLASTCPAGTQVTSGVCYVTKWGSQGTGNGQFKDPNGLVVEPTTHNLYVADTSNNRIQKFTSSGTYITKFGSGGIGNGQFDAPIGIALDNSGFVYVSDGDNDRIQKFRLTAPCPAGTTQIATGVCFATKWGTTGSANGELNGPRGIDLDSSGHVYVTEINNNRIQVFVWKTLLSGSKQVPQFSLPKIYGSLLHLGY